MERLEAGRKTVWSCGRALVVGGVLRALGIHSARMSVSDRLGSELLLVQGRCQRDNACAIRTKFDSLSTTASWAESMWSTVYRRRFRHSGRELPWSRHVAWSRGAASVRRALRAKAPEHVVSGCRIVAGWSTTERWARGLWTGRDRRRMVLECRMSQMRTRTRV